MVLHHHHHPRHYLNHHQPPLLQALLFQPGLTFEEEDALILAFPTVAFHSCIHWGWDSRKLFLEQLWISFLLLLRRIHPDFVSLHTNHSIFNCGPHILPPAFTRNIFDLLHLYNIPAEALHTLGPPVDANGLPLAQIHTLNSTANPTTVAITHAHI